MHNLLCLHLFLSIMNKIRVIMNEIGVLVLSQIKLNIGFELNFSKNIIDK